MYLNGLLLSKQANIPTRYTRSELHIQENKTNSKNITYVDGSTLPYLGKEYTLYLVNCGEGKEKEIFAFQRGRFVAQMTHMNHYKIKLLYEKWLEKQATKLLKKKVYNYCRVIGLDHKALKIRIKSQKNRVGSLGRNLVLNFNKNLLRLPMNIIDHELCHVCIPDHSSKYWQLVGSVMSFIKKGKNGLK